MQYFQEKEKPPNPLMIEGAGGVDAPKALFYIARKVGIMPGNRGNSNFCFLCGSVFRDNAAVDAARDAERGIPIVQS